MNNGTVFRHKLSSVFVGILTNIKSLMKKQPNIALVITDIYNMNITNQYVGIRLDGVLKLQNNANIIICHDSVAN